MAPGIGPQSTPGKALVGSVAGERAAPASQVACADCHARGGGLAQSGTGVPGAGGCQAPENSGPRPVFPSTPSLLPTARRDPAASGLSRASDPGQAKRGPCDMHNRHVTELCSSDL